MGSRNLGPRISHAESVVMEVLWRQSPNTCEGVVAALSKQQRWREPTIKTLLNRLLKKRAISATKEGRHYLYLPILTREQWLSAESKVLLDRLFGGHVAPLVAHFSRHRRMSRNDINELRRLIAELDNGK